MGLIIDELEFIGKRLWGKDAKKKELVKNLKGSLKSLADEKGVTGWLARIQAEHGGLGALTMCRVTGLPGYTIGFFRKFFGGGADVDLVVSEKSLLFFDPDFSPSSKLICVPFRDIVSVREDKTTGRTLIISTHNAKIRCGTYDELDIRPIKEIIIEMMSRCSNN